MRANYDRRLTELSKIYKDLEAKIRAVTMRSDFRTDAGLRAYKAKLDAEIIKTRNLIIDWAEGNVVDFYELGVGDIYPSSLLSDRAQIRVDGFVTRNEVGLGAAAAGAVKLASDAANRAYRQSMIELSTSGRSVTLSRFNDTVIAEFFSNGKLRTLNNLDLSTYAEFIGKDELANSRIAGTADAMAGAGSDLAVVEGGASNHEVCNYYLGQTISISGENTDYPSLDDITGEGMFHMGCTHYVVPLG